MIPLDYSCWLASACNDYLSVSILSDLSKEDAVTAPLKITKPCKKLPGHSGRVTRACWNPHAVGVLASASYDGSVQIWDVDRCEPLANYRGHEGRVMTVMWSFIDADVVYSGGEDFTVRRWRISEQTEKCPPGEYCFFSLIAQVSQ